MYLLLKMQEKKGVYGKKRLHRSYRYYFDFCKTKYSTQITKEPVPTVNTNQLQSLNSTLIPWSTQVKYLGVTIGLTLNFGNHVINIVKKATRTRGMLFPILNRHSYIPAKTRINMMKMYILPVLIYSGAAWAPYITKTQWRRLESYWKRRIIASNSGHTWEFKAAENKRYTSETESSVYTTEAIDVILPNEPRSQTYGSSE
ncbi:hypothetical protein QTP88_017965 [Uroleucon formosanum]